VSALLSAVLVALVLIRWKPLMALDRAVASALHRSALGHPVLTHLNRVLTDWVWDPWTMRALLVATVGWLLWRGERLLAVWVVVVGAVGTAAQQGLKAAVGRRRPTWPDPVDSAHYAAFPSGHAMTAAFACGLLLWLLWLHGVRGWRLRTAAAVAGGSVVGVGFTRIYLGVHWLTDVAAGWLLGAALVAVSAAVHTRLRGPSGRPPGGGVAPRRPVPGP
jgi:undecaprenyl-diphosphatase